MQSTCTWYGWVNFQLLHLHDLSIGPAALEASNIDIDTNIQSITLGNRGENQVNALKNFWGRYHDRADGATCTGTSMPSLGVSGDSAFMVRGSASFPTDVVEIDEWFGRLRSAEVKYAVLVQ